VGSGLTNSHESRFCVHWPRRAARTTSNVGDHSQGAQQGSWASGEKPSWEAPLRALCFVAPRSRDMTTPRSSLRAAFPAQAASRPWLLVRPLPDGVVAVLQRSD